jgi:hypothetical protein
MVKKVGIVLLVGLSLAPVHGALPERAPALPLSGSSRCEKENAIVDCLGSRYSSGLKGCLCAPAGSCGMDF